MIQPAPLPIARILVVDDSEGTRYVLATWLRRAGYHVAEAMTGEQALAATAAQFFDLVVLDVNLPDMSGYAVCERIKAESRNGVIPVLHVSATATGTADVSEGLRRGAEGYLIEPVEREELIATVEALLRAAVAQRTAMLLAWRLRRLNEATHALNEALSLEQLVSTIAREAGLLFESTTVACVVADDRAIAEHSSPFADTRMEAVTPQQVDALRTAAGAGGYIPATTIEVLLPSATSAHYLAAPIENPDGHRGIMLVALTDAVQAHGAENETDVVLTQYARAASTALKNMRIHDIERHIALTLQHSLLPGELPEIPGLQVAVRYEASTEHSEVGGDFYELFSLSDERVVFAIGDVAGHSLEAATVMAQLRTAIRAYALEGHGPAETLIGLNRLLLHFHPDVTATVCCASYDRKTGNCELANAGHLPPLIARSDGVRFLPIGGSLLGVSPPSVSQHNFVLGPGDLLLLFTDGLVERRHESIDAGFERLARATAGTTSNLDELCDRLLREVGPATIVDDIALMAIRRTPQAFSERRFDARRSLDF